MTRPATVFASSLLALLLLLCCGLRAQEEEPKPEKAAEETAEKSKEEASPVDEDGGPVTAWFVKRAITVSGKPIERAVILVQDGVIKAIGVEGEVKIPPASTRHEMRDHVACPGFVHPCSTAFGAASRFNFSGRADSADKSAKDSFDPTREAFKELLEEGYTSIAVIPSGGGIAGQGVLVQPPPPGDGPLDAASLIKEERVVLSMGFAPNTSSKASWTKVFEKARKYLDDLAAFEKAKGSGKAKETSKGEPDKKKEEASKESEAKDSPKKEEAKEPVKEGDGKKPEPKEEKKSGDDKKGEKKPDEKKADEKKAEGPKEPKKDPKVMPLVDVFEGRLAGVLGIAQASHFLHFEAFFKKEKSFRPALLMASSGFRAPMDAWRVRDQIKQLGVPVILTPEIGTAPRSSTRRITQRLLLDAGIPLVLIPPQSGSRTRGGFPGRGGRLVAVPQSRTRLPAFRFHLGELVRHGITQEQVLRAVTLTPAEVLGIQGRCGSLEVGKNADILFFNADPLSPLADLQSVVVRGETVYTRDDKP